MSTELIINPENLPKPKNKSAELIVEYVNRIVPVAPSLLDKKRLAVALVIAANEVGDPDVVPESTLLAAFHCCVIGLIPGAALGHVYFIPRAPKRGAKRRTNCEVGYRGYLDLAFRNNFLSVCKAEVVTRDEVESGNFEMWEDEEASHFLHKKTVDRKPSRENIVGAYCRYKTRLGGNSFEFVSLDEISKVDRQQNVWESHYAAMCKKTAVRRAAKMWQTSSELAQAMYLDEQSDRGEQQYLGLEVPGIADESRPDWSLSELPEGEENE